MNDFKGEECDNDQTRRSVRDQFAHKMRTRGAFIASFLGHFRRWRTNSPRRPESDIETVGDALPGLTASSITPGDATDNSKDVDKNETITTSPEQLEETQQRAAFDRHVKMITSTVKSMFHPITVSMTVGFIVTFVRPLKALFVAVENSPIPNAPDGNPPLAFIIDTCSKSHDSSAAELRS